MIINADCVEAMQAMEPDSIDAIVCDPPYGLEFMGKEWDRLQGYTTDIDFKGFTLPRQRQRNIKCPECDKYVYDHPGRRCECGGVRRMQVRAAQQWHHLWATEALRVLKPGGHLLAFGGTRTYHRLACAVEDAGFEIRDSLIWIYGSGFPKSLNLNGDHQGWGTALKPAHEPIVVARKPLVGTVAANVLEHGTGALNIDGCRIGMREEHYLRRGATTGSGMGYHGAGPQEVTEGGEGRWPPNVTLSHLPECKQTGTRKVKTNPPPRFKDADTLYDHAHGDRCEPLEYGTETIPAYSCAPGCPVAELDRQSGERPGFSSQNDHGSAMGYSDSVVYGTSGGVYNGRREGYGDTGGASRFFLTVQPDRVCVLCGTPCVQSAGNLSSPSDAPSDTALDGAPVKPAPASEDNGAVSSSPASNAGPSSPTTPPTDTATTSTAPPSADTKLAAWIVQHARSAVSLCDSCETAIARSVAQTLHDPTQESLPGPASTLEHRRRTLSQSLALIAEGARSTGIIPTTPILSALCGSAVLATTERTPGSDTESATDQVRHRYCPKSSRAERNAGLEGFAETERGSNFGMDGSRPHTAPDYEYRAKSANVHPTVKPIALMRWLVKLVTPAGGTVLDPFTGSGSTGVAAVLEDFEFIGVEREAEYVALAEARVRFWAQFPGADVDKVLLSDAKAREIEASGQLGLL